MKVNYTNVSDICTESILGLRHKYKCLYTVQKLCSGSCPQHCTVTLPPSMRLTEEKRQRSFRHSAVKEPTTPVWGSFYTVIISFGRKLIIFFICKIYRYIPIRKTTNEGESQIFHSKHSATLGVCGHAYKEKVSVCFVIGQLYQIWSE